MKRQQPLFFSRGKVKKQEINTNSGIMYFPTYWWTFCKQDHQPDDFFCWSYILGVPLQDIFWNGNNWMHASPNKNHKVSPHTLTQLDHENHMYKKGP